MIKYPDGRDAPASARQKAYIARLCITLKYPEPLEDLAMTIGSAGRHINYLKAELRLKNRLKKRRTIP